MKSIWRIVAVLGVAGLLFAGCSSGDDGDDGEDDATTTTETADSTEGADEETDDTDEETDDTGSSDSEVIAAIDDLAQDLADANDVCDLLALGDAVDDIGTTSTPEEVEASVAFTYDFLMAIVAMAPAEFEAEAEVIAAGADALVAEGEENDYAPEWANGSDTPEVFNDEDFYSAMTTFEETATAQCAEG